MNLAQELAHHEVAVTAAAVAVDAARATGDVAAERAAVQALEAAATARAAFAVGFRRAQESDDYRDRRGRDFWNGRRW